jgi:hypothetical protein
MCSGRKRLRSRAISPRQRRSLLRSHANLCCCGAKSCCCRAKSLRCGAMTLRSRGHPLSCVPDLPRSERVIRVSLHGCVR